MIGKTANDGAALEGAVTVGPAKGAFATAIGAIIGAFVAFGVLVGVLFDAKLVFLLGPAFLKHWVY